MGVPLHEAVDDVDPVVLSVRLRVVEGDGLAGRVFEAELVPVPLGVGVPDVVGVTDGEAVPLGVPEGVALPVPVPEGEGLDVGGRRCGGRVGRDEGQP